MADFGLQPVDVDICCRCRRLMEDFSWKAEMVCLYWKKNRDTISIHFFMMRLVGAVRAPWSRREREREREKKNKLPRRILLHVDIYAF